MVDPYLNYNTFGQSIAISGDYAAVGADQETVSTISSAGAVYIFKRSEAGTWSFVQKIAASDPTSFAWFGSEVALSGSSLVVGCGQKKTIYIFEKQLNGTWIEVKKAAPSDPERDNNFGQSIDVSGERIIVGTRDETAYIYEKIGGNWIETQKVTSPLGVPVWFGWTVGISGDQAFIHSHSEGSYRGAVYVYLRDGSGVWSNVQKITSTRSLEGDDFGESMDFSGNDAIFGAPGREMRLPTGLLIGDGGAAEIFKKNSEGIWEFVQVIQPADVVSDTRFGYVTAISDDYAIGGTYFEKRDANGTNELMFAGAAYIFKRNENNVWIEDKKLLPADRNAGDRFASSLDIDGTTAFIGAPYKSIETNLLGAAYIFQACTENIEMIAACESSYTWEANGETYTEPGTYHAASNTGGNCMTYTLELTFVTVDTGITRAGNTLTADAENATFKWFDCTNEPEFITDETSASIMLPASGHYAVEVTQAGCTAVSDCYHAIFVGLEREAELSLSAFPNPTRSGVRINLGNMFEQVTITLMNSLGQKLEQQQYASTQEVDFAIQYKADLYFVQVTTKTGKSAVLKVVKN